MNKLSFSRIEIENFRSIKDKITLDIKPGLFSIEGVNNDEKNSFNGAGKSTIVSALYWCLTGNTLTNEVLADEIINSIANKDCKVTLFINSDKDHIKIIRTRKDSELGNNLILEINDQNLSCHKIADTQERINQIIKLPLNLLKSTLMLTCNMDSAFSELTPNQRVQVLENIRDYTIWNKVRDNANKDIKNYNKSIKDLELDISNFEGSKISYTTILKDIEVEKTKYIENYKNKNYLELLANTEKSIKQYQDEIDKLTKEQEDLQSKIVLSNNNSLSEEMNKIKDYGIALNKQLNQLETNKKTEEQEITFKTREINNQLAIIKDWFIKDVCPTCKRPLERTKEEIEEKTITQKSLERRILNYEKDLVTLIEKYQIEKNNLEKELSESRNKYAELSDKQRKLSAEANIIPNKITNLNKKVLEVNAQLSHEISNKNQIEGTINSYNDTIKSFDEKYAKYVKEIESLQNNIDLKQRELKDFEDKKKISTFFYDLLGPKGELRPYLLKQDIEYLNSFIHHYISRFFTGTNVNLQLENNDIKILIETSEGIKKSISSLSGGEKKRINIAIQLGLYDLMQSVSQVSFNMLCLDEVETQMDPLGCQQLIDIINDKASEIETVYWITNNDMVKENIINKIICRKTNGITIIEEV